MIRWQARWPSSPRTRFIAASTAAYLVLGTAWILFSDALLGAITDPGMAVRLAGAKGLAFVAITAVLLAAALRAVPPGVGEALRHVPARPWTLLLAFVAVATLVGFLAVLGYRAAAHSLRQEAMREVEAIARLKATAAEDWIAEQQADATALARNLALAQEVALWRDDPSPDRARGLVARLERMRDDEDFRGLHLATPEGDILLGAGPAIPDDPAQRVAIRGATLAGRVVLHDLHRDPEGTVRLAYLAPIADADGRIMAVVVLDLDPEEFLFNHLRPWPLPGQSGELLLWRREGDHGVLLDPERFGRHIAIPHEAPTGTYVVSGGPRPHSHGGDETMLAAGAVVANTPWTVTAGLNEDEALAGLRRLVAVSAALAITVMATAFAGIALIWQRQRLRMALTEVVRSQALVAAETRFRATFEQAAVGLAHVSLDRRITRVNRRLCDMSGWPAEALLGQKVDVFLHPDELAGAGVRIADLVAGRLRPYTREGRYRARNGSWLDLAVTVSLVPPEAMTPGYLVAVVQDISARRRAEEALQRSEQRFRQMFDASPLGTALLAGGERRIVQANQAFCAMLGWTAEELFDRSALDLVHPDDLRAPARPGTPAFDQRRTVEWRLLTRSDRVIWARISSARFDAAGDEAPLTLIVVEDITRQRELEAALQRSQRLEAIGQLTGGIAHDFNNLLSIVMLDAEALAGGGLPAPEAARLAGEILATAQHGAELTGRLLAFARQQPLRVEVLDLNAVVSGTADLLRRTLGERIRVELRLGPRLWPVSADASRVADSLVNLALNSRHAMPQGGVLCIATGNVRLDNAAAAAVDLPGGDYVALSVSDTGCGMTPEVLERALEPFFTTREPGVGTGLGLSTTYGFARQSGGHLAIESAPGQGTTVRLLLPRGLPREAGRRAPAPSAVPRGHGTILLVDDNAELRKVATRQLVSLGYEVWQAENGPAALAILRKGIRFDLLFTDEVMPEGMTGSQLAAAARALQPGLKVLLTTGYVRPGSAPDEEAAHHVLRKPYRRAELAERVRAAMVE